MATPREISFGGVQYPVEALTFAQIQIVGPAFWKTQQTADQATWYETALVMIGQTTGLSADEIKNAKTTMPEIAQAIAVIAIVAGLAVEKPVEGDAPGEATGEAPNP